MKKAYIAALLALTAGAFTAFGAANIVSVAAQETDWTAFRVEYTSVRKADADNQRPGGLRFRVDCPP